MGYNPRVPQDRASAQISFVFGGLMILGAIAGLTFADLSETTSRLGIPLWLLFPLLLIFGITVVVNGIRVWRRNGPSTPPPVEGESSPNDPSTPRSARESKPHPIFRWESARGLTVAVLGSAMLIGGIVAIVVGLVVGDDEVIRTSFLVLVSGFFLGLIGFAGWMYFRSQHDADS